MPDAVLNPPRRPREPGNAGDVRPPPVVEDAGRRGTPGDLHLPTSAGSQRDGSGLQPADASAAVNPEAPNILPPPVDELGAAPAPGTQPTSDEPMPEVEDSLPGTPIEDVIPAGQQ